LSCRKRFCAPHHAKSLVLFFLGLAFLVPRISFAQGPLPIQWQYSSLTQPDTVAYSPDGSLLAVGGYGGNALDPAIGGVQLIVTSTGDIRCLPIDPGLFVYSVAFSRDGKTLIVGCGDGDYLELWDITSLTLIASLNTAANLGVNGVAVSPDGTTLAVAGTSINSDAIDVGVLELWDISTRKRIKTFSTSATYFVSSVAFSADGKTLVDGGQGESAAVLEFWNLSTGKQLKLLAPSMVGPFAVALSSDNRTLAIGGMGVSGGILDLWNISSYKLIASLATSASKGVTSVAFSNDGKTLVDAGLGGQAGILEMWNDSTGKMIASLGTEVQRGGPFPLYCPNGPSVAFAPNGRGFADCGIGKGGVLEFWESPSGNQESAMSTSDPAAGSAPLFSPDGKTLLTAGSSTNFGVLQKWDAATGQIVATMQPPLPYSLSAFTISQDGKNIVTGGVTYVNGTPYGGVLQVWDFSLSKLVANLNTAAVMGVQSVAISPDGKTIADGGAFVSLDEQYERIELWDLASSKLITTLNSAANWDTLTVAFSPSGKTLVDCGTNYTNQVSRSVVEFWDVSTGTLIESLDIPANESVSSVQFSPDGKSLAVAAYNLGTAKGELELWSVATGAKVASFDLLANQNVGSIAFTPDGTVLLVGLDNYLEAFSIATQKALGYYDVSAFGLVLSPSGNLIAFTGGLGPLVVAPNPFRSSVFVRLLSVNPSVVTGGATISGTVTLTGGAPVGGMPVILSSGSSAITVPSSVTVPAGKTSMAFTISTASVSTKLVSTLTARIANSSKTATVTITPPVLSTLVLNPTSVVGGKTSQGTVTIGSAAPAGGLVISLKSSSTTATVPASVTISAGHTSATFTVKTSAVTTKTTSTITATFGSTSKTAVLTVTS